MTSGSSGHGISPSSGLRSRRNFRRADLFDPVSWVEQGGLTAVLVSWHSKGQQFSSGSGCSSALLWYLSALPAGMRNCFQIRLLFFFTASISSMATVRHRRGGVSVRSQNPHSGPGFHRCILLPSSLPPRNDSSLSRSAAAARPPPTVRTVAVFCRSAVLSVSYISPY